MIARLWRGWTGADDAGQVVADLRSGPLAGFAATPGNISTDVLLRPLAGGVEIVTLTVWESRAAVPAKVEEAHELLVARQTLAECWEIAPAAAAAIARAA